MVKLSDLNNLNKLFCYLVLLNNAVPKANVIYTKKGYGKIFIYNLSLSHLRKPLYGVIIIETHCLETKNELY